ncbi:MAG: hypothetical protein RLZZ200_501 [Pseudomonadota bacterium]|jgi:DNA-binding PadR family transcriptional regulator
MAHISRYRACYPTLHEIAALRVLARKDNAYAREVSHGSRGKIPIDQIYMILKRLRAKGTIEVLPEPRVPPEGGLPQKLYRITRFGRRCIKAMDILEGK